MNGFVREMESLFQEFLGETAPPIIPITAAEMPIPYRVLLDHEDHMTVTMESYHSEMVRLGVLAENHHNHTYSRILHLIGVKTGKTVLFGAMRVHLNYLPEAARGEILGKGEPLGRILIRHQVMRKLELVQLLRIDAGPAQTHWFGFVPQGPLSGRLALIHCQGLPAVEPFEVVCPEN